MVYEWRTYWAMPGKGDQLHERFRTLVLPLFQKHQIHLLGLWIPEPVTLESGDIKDLVWFPSEEARLAAWEAFRQDPTWISGKARSEENGPLIANMTSHLLKSASYAPDPRTLFGKPFTSLTEGA